MREYIVSVLCAVATLAILSLISYKENGDTGKRIAFAVLFIWISFVPLAKDVLSLGDIRLPSIDIDISDYTEEYKNVAEDAFSRGVKTLICDKFSLDGELVRVLVEGFDFESMSASRIRVILSGKAALASYKDIEKYIEDQGFGECDAEIEIGK
ncbi:MAG: hypothetical protein IJW03_05355 [Clostridia bacterium]|nr:hypothetical protein [Clostridia bacterium]